MTTVWNIYYRDREYSRVMGDPLLGRVTAATQEEARQLAARDNTAQSQVANATAGLWAVPKAHVDRRQAIERRQAEYAFQFARQPEKCRSGVFDILQAGARHIAPRAAVISYRQAVI